MRKFIVMIALCFLLPLTASTPIEVQASYDEYEDTDTSFDVEGLVNTVFIGVVVSGLVIGGIEVRYNGKFYEYEYSLKDCTELDLTKESDERVRSRMGKTRIEKGVFDYESKPKFLKR